MKVTSLMDYVNLNKELTLIIQLLQEEKMEKLKIQFDRAAVESKKTMTKLEDENSKLKTYIEEVKTDLEKKEVECRTLNTKLSSLEKEFNRYKTWAKAEADKCETTVEEMEARISEVRLCH